MRLTFLGATHEVTGSCFYLEVGEHKLLIDCGMEQGPDEFENQEIPVAASEIEAVLLTHAHIDHSGNLPLLYQRGFRGQIFTTEATRDLCQIMPTFRCLRRSGGTGKAGEPEKRKFFPYMT